MTEHQLGILGPQAAWDLMQKDPRTLLVDVRSSMEFLFVGHPVGAVNIAWIDEPDWAINPHFVTEVRQLLLGGLSCSGEKDGPSVVLICRSGKRSHEAGKLLIERGINKVFHIDEGFEGELDDRHRRSSLNGWRFRGLPWEQC